MQTGQPPAGRRGGSNDARRAALVEAYSLAVQELAGRQASVAAVASLADAAGRDDEHDPDGATVAFEHALASGLVAQSHERVVALEQALARADAGTYGLCQGCGHAIACDRLEAEPATPWCVTCAARNSGPFGLRRGGLERRKG